MIRHSMKHGLYRTFDPLVGECAGVSREAGDAYPVVARTIYESLGFQPMFDWLPAKEDYERLHLERLTGH